MIADYEVVDNVDQMTLELRHFLLGKPVEEDVPREQCTTTLTQDGLCSFAPENYISSGKAPVNAAFRYIGSVASNMRASAKRRSISKDHPTRPFMLLEQFVAKVEASPLATLKEWAVGNVPVVSATEKNNGVAGWHDIPNDLCFDHCITVSILNNTKPCEAFWHPYRFSALIGKAFVLKPIPELLENVNAILYLCESITVQNSWRYYYARAVKLPKLEVVVPVTDSGQPDIAAMGEIVMRQLGSEA